MKKGFTLVELLVVIAIIAVLGTAVVLVLNPAELIKQGRDSTRLSDLGNLNNAVALYLSQTESPGLGGANDAACTTLVRCTGVNGAPPLSPFSSANCTVANYSATTTTDGTGWMTIDLQNITGGSPLSRLPLDPLFNSNSSSTYYYAYTCAGLNYEIDARLESSKYASSSAAGDGGNQASWYEVGNTLSF